MPRPDTGTRQKLIDTARNLIWTSSYGAVSVDDICRAANVKKGSFYHYFPSKQDLALATMEEYYQHKIESILKPVFAANKSFRDQIGDMAEAILRDNRQNLADHGCVCGCPLAALGSEMIGQEEQAIREKVEEIFTRCQEFFLGAMTRAIENGEIKAFNIHDKSQEVHDFITGLMIMARIHNSLDGLERDLKSGLMRILELEPLKQTAEIRI
jgi:TetR/AcrR family transcriptional repressor of nem operon